MQNAKLVILNSVSLGTNRNRVVNMLAHEHTAAFLNSVATDLSKVATLNQKGAMRLVEACQFAVSGDAKMHDKGTAMLVAAIALTEQNNLTFADLHYLMGKANAHASHIAGVSRAKLMKFIGRVGSSRTIESKLSRTVSDRGFFSILGISVKGTAHSCELTASAKSNPLVTAYAYQLQSMSEQQFELLYKAE